jgi:hypothetical protein
VDYGFAPGASAYDGLMRHLLDDRPNTDLISLRAVRTVADFFQHLEATAAIPKPVGNLLIASHGNDSGWMQIDLDGALAVDTQYEVVEQAVTSGSVTLPKDLYHNADGTVAATTIQIRGCRIGVAEPFVDKLKEAFGGDVPVGAPKHFHVVFPGNYANGLGGMFEYLAYSFKIVRRDPFGAAERGQLVAAFAGAGFTLIDGSAVPGNRWDKWVPSARRMNRTRTRTAISVPLGQQAGTITTLRDSNGREFRHDVDRFTFTITGLAGPPAEADQMNVLRNAINASPKFAAAHPFPINQRYGHATGNDFVNGMRWAFNWQAGRLVCVGTQNTYTVVVPVTESAPDPAGRPPDPPSGNLLFNFYPRPGGAAAVVETMPVGDGRLFYTA